jgi:GntR family transcriptional regulator
MNAATLYDILRTSIQNGRIPLNSQMPSEMKLCKEHGLSRGTVRAALQRLAEEGYLRSEQGRQRIVQRCQPLRLERLRISFSNYTETCDSPSFGRYLVERGLKVSDTVLRIGEKVLCRDLVTEFRLDQGRQLSKELNISSNDKVNWFLRLRTVGETPIVLQWVVIPSKILSDVPPDSMRPGGLTQLYGDNGIKREHLRGSYSSTRASKSEAGPLRVTTGAPLLEERRVSYYKNKDTGEDVPYEYLVSLYTERVALMVEWDDRRKYEVSAHRKGPASRNDRGNGSKNRVKAKT